ncbi:MAG: nucleotide exchange factor GrpE, partial [Gammaproteobacteria bacterium]
MSSKQKTPDFQEKKDVEPAEGEPKKDAGETRSVAAEEQKVSQPGESEKPDVVEKLTAELEEANKRAQENWDRVVRLQAEMDNLRRRTQKDVENAHKFALEGFSKELLTVIDSLELGIQAA